MMKKNFFKKKYQHEVLDTQSYAYFVDYLRKHLAEEQVFEIKQDNGHWPSNTEGKAASIATICNPLSYALNCSVSPKSNKNTIEIDSTQSSKTQTVINYIANVFAFLFKTLLFYFLVIFLMSILHMGGWSLLLSKKYLFGVVFLAVVAGLVYSHHEIVQAKKFNLKALYF